MKKTGYIGVVVVIVVFAFVYTNYRKGSTNPVVSTASTSTTTTEIQPFDFQGVQVDTSDWQTYRNEQYGYEFKYPRGWKEDVSMYEGMSPEQIVSFQKSKDSYKRVVLYGYSENSNSIPVIDVHLYKGIKFTDSKFGLANLETEINTRLDKYKKVAKFNSGSNTIVILTSYFSYGPTKSDVAEMTAWLVNKNDEVFNIFVATREDGQYTQDNIKHITGVYRTFKTTN